MCLKRESEEIKKNLSQSSTFCVSCRSDSLIAHIYIRYFVRPMPSRAVFMQTKAIWPLINSSRCFLLVHNRGRHKRKQTRTWRCVIRELWGRLVEDLDRRHQSEVYGKTKNLQSWRRIFIRGSEFLRTSLIVFFPVWRRLSKFALRLELNSAREFRNQSRVVKMHGSRPSLRSRACSESNPINYLSDAHVR